MLFVQLVERGVAKLWNDAESRSREDRWSAPSSRHPGWRGPAWDADHRGVAAISAQSASAQAARADQRAVEIDIGAGAVLGDWFQPLVAPHIGRAAGCDDARLQTRLAASRLCASSQERRGLAARAGGGIGHQPAIAQAVGRGDRAAPASAAASRRLHAVARRRRCRIRPARSITRPPRPACAARRRLRRCRRPPRSRPAAPAPPGGQLGSADDVEGDQHVVDAGGGHDLGLAELLHGDAAWRPLPAANFAMPTSLWVLTCGRFARPSASQRCCQREMLRSATSRSTTGTGVSNSPSGTGTMSRSFRWGRSFGGDPEVVVACCSTLGRRRGR